MWMAIVVRIFLGQLLQGVKISGATGNSKSTEILGQTGRSNCWIGMGDLTWRRRLGMTTGLGVSLIEQEEFLY